jgi:hypothetical protein
MRCRWGILAVVAVTSLLPTRALAANPREFPTKEIQPTMVISKTKVLTAVEARRILAAVTSAGASGYTVNFPFIPLTAHTRGTEDLLRLRDGWRIAMATMVVSPDYIRAVGGDDMANAMAPGSVLMGESSAKVRKAQVGDVLMLRNQEFAPRYFTVGAIVPDAFVDWGDITMSPESASVLGGLRIANVTVTNISSPSAIVAALTKRGIPIGKDFRIRRSWDNPNPDKQLGTGVTKAMMGEFSFRPTTGGSIVVSPDFLAKNIVWRHRYDDIPLVNNCHRKVIPAIQGALTEIKKAGLEDLIDVQNSNSAGGCFVGRYNRLAKMYGSPSRHAWGMALDINTNTNQQGTTPQLNCRIVSIFRKWGFAWGGGFYPADGMHFEYVGDQRHDLGFRSRYCSNKVPIPSTTLPQFPTTTQVTSNS